MPRWVAQPSGGNSMFLSYSPPGGHRETTCHLCLRDMKPSDEHIPPKSAFNNRRRLWEHLNSRMGGPGEDRRRGGGQQTFRRVWQAGFYVRTLCEECNNGTGTSSAEAYVRFVKSLVEAPRLFDPGGSQRVVAVREDTLAIARQIAVMILAIEDVRFALLHDDLRLFAKGHLDSVLPPFRVFAFLVPDHPHAGTIAPSHGRLDLFAPGHGALAGEISLYPFGFVYAFELQRAYRANELADITHWFSVTAPTERRNAWLSAPVTVTVLDSQHCTLGNPRFGPQIDKTPER